MASTSNLTSDEAALRAGIEERVQAIRTKDVDRVLSGYAADVATFDLMAPLANLGVEAVRKRLGEWFSSFQGDIDYEIRDVSLAVSGDVAFDHHFTHVLGTNKAGETVEMWFRETIGYRKVDGRWKVTHQHSSVPFDMTSGKPLFDLKP